MKSEFEYESCDGLYACVESSNIIYSDVENCLKCLSFLKKGKIEIL